MNPNNLFSFIKLNFPLKKRGRVIFETSIEVIHRLKAHGLGWVVPVFIILLALASLFGILALVPSLAPFVYPLF
jgi:hypothetical protein